ncbi:MAG: radical SAM protein [Defluviitaleaceae bacterium]|nr:radical SAM protein [Defluviitaleaceae bacterium]
MKQKPSTAIWEVTMGCNMRCAHCGSSCKEPLPDELTTDEALSLVDQIAELGLKWITISGGEPLTRVDLPIIIERFVSHSIVVNIITNGWLLEPQMAEKLKNSGVSTIAISLDGTEKTHDKIRQEGSYERIFKAFKALQEVGIATGAVTTISNENIGELPEMRKILTDNGIKSWQLQIGFPMGNFKDHPEWVVAPEKMNDIIDFCYETSMEGQINIYPADCIGYYSEKEQKIRQNTSRSDFKSIWQGCNAGVHVFGILHNGDIIGCTSIRDTSFIEGNIRDKSLNDIWNNPENFTWCRNMTKDKLTGNCSICNYGSICLGGCPNTRLTMNGDIYSENKYCSYNLALKNIKESLQESTDVDQLIALARTSISQKNYQTAALFTERVLAIEPENQEALSLSGFAEFMCGNYIKCEQINRKVLQINPNDVYAIKGLGLALHKQGNSSQGLEFLERAAKLTNYEDSDIMHDLAYVKQEMSLKVG